MPHLYRLDAPASTIAATFTADAGPDPWTGDYVAPAKFAPVVIPTRTGRIIVPRQWGVPPPPKIALEGGRPVYTVRNLDSPFWTGTLRHSEFRCLVPATSFMLLGGPARADAGSSKAHARTQHWFSLPSEPVFALAGIWRDNEVPSFALLTCDPNPALAAAGAVSMPVILNPWDHGRWLTADWDAAKGLVEPYPSQLMAEETWRRPGNRSSLSPMRPRRPLYIMAKPTPEAQAAITALPRNDPGRGPELLHVTLMLLFDLHNAPPEWLPAVTAALDSLRAAPFPLHFDRIENRKAVTLRTRDPLSEARAFQQTLVRHLLEHKAPMMLGTTPEPHVTINYHGDRMGAQKIAPIGWTVDEILLVESVVGKATHVVHGRWRLASGATGT